ncbi:DUF2891 domain-containing protein [Noviherbaspirillum aridicola]|uniref:DUF2891 family protein n=1 Tax=Noviherbaspirillum aridicola TaxID=2849687 RepID=A0ABQ4Q7W3_9BURK|nr:DUF2891 domain-containing protein [Noviherbaspirillum aridicola]GIZ52870.1 hypothetical protein NCCP691_28840 [Noviherbaspirillum aridicola]
MDALAPLASAYAQVALANIVREFPNKPDHLLRTADDLRPPRALHPVFYGSYDWHSSVHMHWTLVRLLRLCPGLPEAHAIRGVLDSHFTISNVEAERGYMRQPGRETFERPYGWAWLLKLQAELALLANTDAHARRWQASLAPLADAVVDRFLHFLPRARYPVRAGTHGNSAFALLLALDYAQAQQHLALRKLISERANQWFGQDRRYPAAYEPGGEDFLSPGLVEAALMLRLVDGCSFADWWHVFRPAQEALGAWLLPVDVDDRSDARLSHLDGLNLSRAWCWRLLLPEMPAELRPAVEKAIDAHLAASLPHVAHGPYVGTHWLASFALLALSPTGCDGY